MDPRKPQSAPETSEIDSRAVTSPHAHEEETSPPQITRSSFADALEALKQDTLSAVAKRERVPQPLFWSLFHARLAELKQQKEDIRNLEAVFGSKSE